jgi:hypothetical protein
MTWNNWLKLGKPRATPKSPSKKPKTPKGNPGQPPSWMADKWNKTKRVAGATMTLGTGVALGSMIPFSASKSTEKDIDRMRSYETADGR